MFITPSKIRKNKILTGRTLTFETVKKTHGNIVIIPTVDKTDLVSTIKSRLFRPTQLFSLFTPRRIQAKGRSIVTVNQKDYYSDMRTLTNGRIKKGKTTVAAYNGQNIIYDIFNDFIIHRDALDKMKNGRALQNDIIKYMESKFLEISNDPDYENTYIVFPMTRPYENPQKVLVSCTDFNIMDPLALFLLGIEHGLIDLKKLQKVKGIFFYVPESDIILALDINNPDFEKDWPAFQQKLKRINSLNSGEITIDNVLDVVSAEYVDDAESELENKKEIIRNAIFSKISKDIKANLNDFEATSQKEKDLIAIIDDKIEKFIAKASNMDKTIADMISEVESDVDVKTKALQYVETRKASVLRADNLSKGLEKEAEIISSIQDLDEPMKDNTARIIDVDIPYFDTRVKTSRLVSLDSEYNKKQSNTDIANVLSGFSESSFYPMTVDSIGVDDSSTYSDEKYTYNVRYKTSDGKPLSFQLDVPKIVDNRYFYLGGNKKVIKKQLIRLPIVKTKSDRVELTTNFAKMTIERTSGKVSRKVSYILKRLKEIGEQETIKIDYGDNSVVNAKLGYINDFDYEELGSNINTIKTPSYYLIFNRDNMLAELDLYADFEKIGIEDNFFETGRTPFGFEMVGDTPKSILFIEKGSIKNMPLNKERTESIISEDLFDFIIKDVLKLDLSILPSIGKAFVYTTVKFLATTYPMLAVVASQNGLTDILNRYIGKDNYFKSAKPVKNNIDYVEVRFKDTYLYYKDETKNSLLLNAIYLFNTRDYNYADFDTDIPYTHFFMRTLGNSVGMHTRNTLRINLEVFIDPITRDILRDLRQPTNIIDVLLYSNTLLVGNQYKPQNDMTNYRIRGNELVADIMYQTIADAYVNYQKHRLNGRPQNLSVPKGILIKKLLEQPNINDKSTLNPTLELEQVAQSSAKGFRGVNINDAYTLEMRAYDDSMSGVVSGNATPYSGQAGITRSLSFDPKINSVRGYIPYSDGKELSAANILSPTELLSSFTAAGADAPRQAMQVAQTSHTMPIKSPSKQLFGSGMNKTIGYIISDDFCFKAKKDGFIEKIDTKNKIVVLSYVDDTKDAIDLQSILSKNSGMGFYIRQDFKLVYSEGEHFKENDIIAYNPSYFSGKGKDVDYLPGTLAKVAIAPSDNSYEDSTIICETLGERCASNINMLKQIALGKNTVIHNIKDIGDTVETGEHVIEFTNSFEDPDTVDFLQTLTANIDDETVGMLTRESVDAKFAGRITNIEIYYNCPFEELHVSMQNLIKKFRKRLTDRANVVKDIKTGNVHVPPLEQINAKKIGKQDFPMDGGMIINVWTEYEDVMNEGDKLTFNTALKGIVSKVLKVDEAPISEWRIDEPVEAILTPTGIISRMTTDIYLMLFSNKVLIETGKQIREIWNDKR